MRWLLPIILIGSGIAGFLLITQPIYNEALVIKEEADTYKEALANSEILQKERDRLTEKFNGFSPSDLERLEKIVPDSVDNIKLILEIQEVAQNQGILISNVEFEPEQFVDNEESTSTTSTQTRNQQANLRRPGVATNLDYDIFDLEFSVSGRYDAFIDFMRLLEQSLRVVDIKTISFTPGTSENRDKVFSDDYRYTFRVNTFRLKDL